VVDVLHQAAAASHLDEVAGHAACHLVEVEGDVMPALVALRRSVQYRAGDRDPVEADCHKRRVARDYDQEALQQLSGNGMVGSR
jgi:hypothetical protein